MNEFGNPMTESQEIWDRSEGQRRGPSTVENVKNTVADKLHAAASSIHETAARQYGRNDSLGDFGNHAADWLDRSATYVREADGQKVRADLEQQVRTNPGRSLLIAGVAGLLLGAIFRRR